MVLGEQLRKKFMERYSRVFEKIDDWVVDNIPGFIYRIPTRLGDQLRIWKWGLQRIFRSYHASDRDMWELHDHLAEVILPKLVAFKKSYRHGMPIDFLDYEENAGWRNKEEYDADVAAGRIVGGGPEAWEATIDEMIFAFEFAMTRRSGKYERDFFKKYPQYNWKAKTEKARQVMRWAHMRNGSMQSLDEFEEPPEGTVKVSPGLVDLGDNDDKDYRVYYHDMDLEIEAHKRAEKGLALFAKYFFSLWD